MGREEQKFFSQHLGHMTKMAVTPMFGNQRTDGPVNAHLISEPIYKHKSLLQMTEGFLSTSYYFNGTSYIFILLI